MSAINSKEADNAHDYSIAKRFNHPYFLILLQTMLALA